MDRQQHIDVVVEEGTQNSHSRKSLYAQDDRDSEEGHARPFVTNNKPSDKKEQRSIKALKIPEESTKNSKLISINPEKLPDIHSLPTVGVLDSSLSSPMNSLNQTEIIRNSQLPQLLKDQSSKIEGYNDEECRRFQFNTIRTLELKEETLPKHSSYGPRVNRYLSKSITKEKPRESRYQQLGNTLVSFSLEKQKGMFGRGSQSLSVNHDKSQRSIAGSLTKIINQYKNESSPALNNINELLQKISKHLEPTLLSYPFQIDILSPLISIKTNITKYMASLISPPPKQSIELCSDWQPEKMTDYLMKYKPRSRKLNQSMINLQSELALKKYKNCVYFGGIRDGRKQGYGILMYFGKNACIFQGQFDNDEKAEGVETRADQIYIGKYANGLKQDQNGMLLTKQKIYFGCFRKGLWVDMGISIDDKGMSFYSEEIDVFKSNKNDLYIGRLHSNQATKYGFGLQLFNNGDVYLGNYELSKPEGYGQYYWASGARYKGAFFAGQRHGRGIWSIAGGDTYQGEYINDKKCGEGTYTWKNGCKYVGQFQNDLRHGYGQMVYTDGRIEKGSWVDGVQRGKRSVEIGQPIKPASNKTAFRNTRQIFRINRTVYKKARISRAMQMKLERMAGADMNSDQNSSKNEGFVDV